MNQDLKGKQSFIKWTNCGTLCRENSIHKGTVAVKGTMYEMVGGRSDALT